MALKLAAGDFNVPVVIKEPIKTRTTDGGWKVTHTNRFNTLAAERSVDQRRVLESGGSLLVDTRLFYIRYSSEKSSINKDWLFNVQGIDYIIHAKPVLKDSGLKVLEVLLKSVHNG